MKCWVQILDSHGDSYKGSSVDKITLNDNNSDVADLRDAVKLKNPTILSSTDASQLLVYQSREDLTNSQPIARLSAPVQGLGLDVDNAVFVVVPDDSPQGTSV